MLGSWTDICKKIKLNHLLTSYTRINSKQVKDLNVRLKTIKTLNNMGSKMSHISYRNIFSDISPWAGRTKINKQRGLHQTKKFLHRKENHQQNEKATHWVGEHICQYIW